MKRVSHLLALTALVGGMTAASAGVASAAHCTDRGAPGNSDYVTHVQATNGNGDHNEGTHKGFSSCNPNSKNYAP